MFSRRLLRGTHGGLGFDHVIGSLAAAAVFHSVPCFFIEDNTEEENKGTLELDDRKRLKVSKKAQLSRSSSFRVNRWAHLHTVETSEQVVEDDHVAVDGEECEKTRD